MDTLPVDHTWTEKVTVDGETITRERTVHLIVKGPADMHMGMVRSLYMEEQKLYYKESKPELVERGFTAMEMWAEEILRTFMFPSMLAAVSSHEGFSAWPVSYEEFSSMPEELGVKWEEAVLTLNPSWKFKLGPETEALLEEARKKVMNGTSESPIE